MHDGPMELSPLSNGDSGIPHKVRCVSFKSCGRVIEHVGAQRSKPSDGVGKPTLFVTKQQTRVLFNDSFGLLEWNSEIVNPQQQEIRQVGGRDGIPVCDHLHYRFVGGMPDAGDDREWKTCNVARQGVVVKARQSGISPTSAN